MNLAYLTIAKVRHVGTFDVAMKGATGSQSHEGHCLSVSDCPDVWRRIARLGDAPCWELSRPGGKFVDVHKSLRKAAVRKALAQWALANGLARLVPAWAAYQEDLEDPGTWQYSLHTDEEEARAELEDPAARRPNGKPCLEPCELLQGTERLAQRIGFSLGNRPVDDFILACWVEDAMPEVDGLWWSDRLEPALLSAPRGGIFPSRVARWSRSRT